MRTTVAYTRHADRGFTLPELLVILTVAIVLASILVPFLMRSREADRRVRCAENLRTIYWALGAYAKVNENNFPRVRYDAAGNPNGYTAFTGPDAASPFAVDSAVQPNDVTASLWLLIRCNLLDDARRFVCPSTADEPDSVIPKNRRSNFRLASNLSYGYSTPFSSADWYRMNDAQPADFAIMADKGPTLPVQVGGALDPAYPAYDSPPIEKAPANSINHNRAGQNVLYADGHVAFQMTPYCGVRHDNIYTALAPKPLEPGNSPPPEGKGFWGPRIGPSWNADSYLVPTDGEGPR